MIIILIRVFILIFRKHYKTNEGRLVGAPESVNMRTLGRIFRIVW